MEENNNTVENCVDYFKEYKNTGVFTAIWKGFLILDIFSEEQSLDRNLAPGVAENWKTLVPHLNIFAQ